MLIAILCLSALNLFLTLLLACVVLWGGKHLDALIRKPIGIPMFTSQQQSFGFAADEEGDEDLQ